MQGQEMWSGLVSTPTGVCLELVISWRPRVKTILVFLPCFLYTLLDEPWNEIWQHQGQANVRPLTLMESHHGMF